MQHAFAMTNEYAIIFDPPWYMQEDFYSMTFKSSDMLDMIKQDHQGTMKLHVVRLSDGEVTTIDTKEWQIIMHFSNAYKIDEDTLVVEGPAYEKAGFDPFRIFTTHEMNCADCMS
jgi:carotenoid cleavage dioxygenase-like enzyme